MRYKLRVRGLNNQTELPNPHTYNHNTSNHTATSIQQHISRGMTREHAMRSGLAALARRHAAQRGRAGRGDVGLAAWVETRAEGVRRVP